MSFQLPPVSFLPFPLTSYDERLSGFGWNKVLHIEALQLRGYAFRVVPNVYIVHRPHAPSLDLVAFRHDAAAAACVKDMAELVRQEQRRSRMRVAAAADVDAGRAAQQDNVPPEGGHGAPGGQPPVDRAAAAVRRVARAAGGQGGG